MIHYTYIYIHTHCIHLLCIHTFMGFRGFMQYVCLCVCIRIYALLIYDHSCIHFILFHFILFHFISFHVISFHSWIIPFVRSFIRSFLVYSFLDYFVHSFIYLFVCIAFAEVLDINEFLEARCSWPN